MPIRIAQRRRVATGSVPKRPSAEVNSQRNDFGHPEVNCLRHYDACVRTTLTIDPDVQKLLQEETQRSRKPFKQIVNEALRRGLTRRDAKPRKLVLKVHDGRLRPGYDPTSFNALADELEDQAVLRRAARSPK
jgi:hypothetical protein